MFLADTSGKQLHRLGDDVTVSGIEHKKMNMIGGYCCN